MKYIYIILLFIIVIIICYTFWITIINKIDKKLNNINIDIKYPNIESFDNNKKNEEKIYEENKIISESVEETIKVVNTKIIDSNGKVIKEPNKFKFDMEGFDNKDLFKSWNIEKKIPNVCCKNHIHIKDGKNTKCTYGVTNYADPKDMSPIDLRIFYLNYPPNITLQDYINWLYCYIGMEDQLPYNHLKNLEKLKLGKELIAEDGVTPPPGYYFPAMNAKDYFDKMYNNMQEFNIATPLNSTTGPMMGYNYKDYSEFSTDMNGDSGEIRNPDIGVKKNAKELYNYINPKDSNSLNIDNEYQIYRMKNVEI
jgi:hypothetical protein